MGTSPSGGLLPSDDAPERPVSASEPPSDAFAEMVLDGFDRRAGRGDPLAGGNDGGMADDGYQIAVSARLRPQNAKAVLGVVEGDPFNEACENFLSR